MSSGVTERGQIFCIAFMIVPESIIVGVEEGLYLKRIEDLVMTTLNLNLVLQVGTV